MNPASNRAVQRRCREAMAEYELSGETEAFRQALLWLLHDAHRPDLVTVAFAGVQINVSIECAVAGAMNERAMEN